MVLENEYYDIFFGTYLMYLNIFRNRVQFIRLQIHYIRRIHCIPDVHRLNFFFHLIGNIPATWERRGAVFLMHAPVYDTLPKRNLIN